MNSSRDVTLCKQAAFGVAMGNAGGEVKHQTMPTMARATTTPSPETF